MSKNTNKDLNAVDCNGLCPRNDKEQGRSMVEMLGSMAIMGVLSVGAIGGYSYAMNKHRTNELIYEATKRAQWVGTQLELNRNPANLSILGFGTNKFAGGEIYGVSEVIDNQFEIQIKDVTEAVCENLIRNSGDNNIIRFVVNPDTHEEISTRDCTDSIKVGLVFNRDLSTNDPTETPEVSGEVSGEATGGYEPEETATGGYEPEETATVTEMPKDPECNYHGEWYGSYCNCYDGYQGSDCSDDSLRTYCSNHGYLNSSDCLCDSGWGGADCSVQNPCSGHGYWENCGGDMYCVCEIGWGGSDCSEEADSPSPEMSVVTTTGGYEPEETATVTVQNNNDHSCSGNGYWDDYMGRCSCNTGWGGSDCSEDKSNACSGHGTWYGYLNNGAGGCSCNSGWGGSDCSEDKSNACNGHGTWNGSSCTCDSGTDWIGGDCTCSGRAYYCNGNGTFNNSSWTCQCDTGWYGYTCETQDVRVACDNKGTWTGTGCECDPGASCLYEMDVLRPPASCL